MKVSTKLLFAAAALAVSTPVWASSVAYTTQATFVTAIGSFATTGSEFWDTTLAGTTIASGGSLNGITYTTKPGTTALVDAFAPRSAANSLGRVGGDDGAFVGADTITFTFSQAIRGFGISAYSQSRVAGAYAITASNNDFVLSGPDAFFQDDGQFVGLVSDTNFTSITFRSLTGFSYLLDNMFFAYAPSTTSTDTSAVPLPASSVGGLALAGLLASRRRR